MTQAQLESPAQLGRKQRVKDFKQFVEANRKAHTESEIIALYGIQSGLRTEVLKDYLKLFYNARLYVKPRYITKWMILTPKENDKAIEDYERKKKEEAKRNHDLDYGIE